MNKLVYMRKLPKQHENCIIKKNKTGKVIKTAWVFLYLKQKIKKIKRAFNKISYKLSTVEVFF